MFEYAAVKVAMGNGSEKIKALADYITQDMFHYGIRNGLEYLDLYKPDKNHSGYCLIEAANEKEY